MKKYILHKYNILFVDLYNVTKPLVEILFQKHTCNVKIIETDISHSNRTANLN